MPGIFRTRLFIVTIDQKWCCRVIGVPDARVIELDLSAGRNRHVKFNVIRRVALRGKSLEKLLEGPWVNSG